MKTNFEIDDNIGVKYGGIHIDLHNNFDLKSKQANGKNISIEFIKRNDDWVHEKEFKKLTFIHKNVNYEFYENGNNEEYPEDENTLVSSDISQNRFGISFMERTKPETEDDIIYIF